MFDNATPIIPSSQIYHICKMKLFSEFVNIALIFMLISVSYYIIFLKLVMLDAMNKQFV